MHSLLTTKTFEDMRVGVALDEGLANVSPERLTTFYGERAMWWIVVKAEGPTGHGSRFIEGTATNALTAFMQCAWRYRKEQRARVGLVSAGCQHCEALKLGDVTSVNLTMMRAGVTPDSGKSFNLNVIPTEARAGFDIRIPVTLKPADLGGLLDGWCREAEQEAGAASGSVTWSHSGWLADVPTQHHVSDTEKSIWWDTFSNAVTSAPSFEGKVKIAKEIFPAGTDSRLLRKLGIPAFGFSPMRGCPILLHEHNEYLPRRALLEGAQVYEGVVQALANQPGFGTDDEGGPRKRQRVDA